MRILHARLGELSSDDHGDGPALLNPAHGAAYLHIGVSKCTSVSISCVITRHGSTHLLRYFLGIFGAIVPKKHVDDF